MNAFLSWVSSLTIILVSCLLLSTSCNKAAEPLPEVFIPDVNFIPPPKPMALEINRDIPVRGYFEFMDSLVAHLDTTLSYCIDEHVIVQANPWLIDTLAHTDYYYQMARDVFCEDPQAMTALGKGQHLIIPDSVQADSISKKMMNTLLDVNIPEYKLRIIEDGQVRYNFPVRVGRNHQKYLAMAGKKVDLRTRTGEGSIIRINRFPVFINPSDNRVYRSTRRDDGMVTKLPGVPWIEPVLDGQRYGQLIHPTTNPATLGKAYSNGCIGVGEGDMWRIYYHAPIGTRVVVRYDLEVIDEKGDTTLLQDIYPGYRKRSKRIAKAVQASFGNRIHPAVCDCGIIESNDQ